MVKTIVTGSKKQKKPALVHWTASIKWHHPSKRWRLLFVAVILYALLILISLREYLFAAVVVLGAVSLLLAYRQKDEVVHGAELRDGVIRIGARSYVLKDYKAFKRGPVSGIDMILLVPRKWYAAHYGYVDLSEDEAENKRLVEALKSYGLEERAYKEDWADKVERKIGI